MTTLPTNPYIVGVNVIPSSGEFVYDSVAYSAREPGTTSFAPINTYFSPGGTKTDFEFALDQIQAALPNCAFVALVVQWMVDSLDASACHVFPSTTYWNGVEVGAFEPTAGGADSWRVSGLTLADCNAGLIAIPRDSTGASTYGGTCSDQSVVRAIQAIKARGLKVALYLQVNSIVTGQPWRGLITYSPDISSAATSAVNAFLGSATTSQFTPDYTNLTVAYSGSKYNWTYRRFVLHYANLCVVAGGVNLFTIGSELRGIEAIRGPAWTPAGTTDSYGHATWDYPFVAGLITLANDCRAVFDAAGLTKNLATRANLITYSADWSQWTGAQHAGITGIFPHLDPLYASPNIDLASFDNYLPLTDWTTGSGGLDAANWSAAAPTIWPVANPNTLGLGLSGAPTIYNEAYLQRGIEGGEKGQYYYGNYTSSTTLDPNGTGVYVTAPQGDRLAQSRNRYYVGQELFAFKNLRWWWNNSHKAVYDANDGLGTIPRGVATAWVPQSKPTIFMEYGAPSIDRSTNTPNLFYNPSSVAGGTPFWCNWQSVDGGTIQPARDDLLQYLYYKVIYDYWVTQSNNATVGGVPMIAFDLCFAWNADARPFPVFPIENGTWSDGINWQRGDWLIGKGPALLPPAPPTPPGAGSYATFPTLLGEGWSVHYSPRFSTKVSGHASGRETRHSLTATPMWDIELSFDFLRQGSPYAEFEALVAFLGQTVGQQTPFLFAPPQSLGVYAGAALGTGDGVTTSFRVSRALNGFVENVQAFMTTPTVYANGTPVSASNYAVSILPGTITFASAPASGTTLTISFSAAHVARLVDDSIDFEGFMSAFWLVGKLQIETVRA